MKAQGKKILVTGAGGFIGSHLTERLLDMSAAVTAFVRYTSTGRIGHLAGIDPDKRSRLRIVHGDIRDRDDVMRAVSGNDCILHLAAQIAIPYSYIAPADFISVNTVGTLNILSAARDLGVARVVHMSTSEVYGSAQYLPIDEQHPLVAQSPYAASKIAADKLAESFHCSFNLPVVIARPFNTYGPRQSARAVVPTIILQALRGNTIRLGNTTTRRDLNFVVDTARALAMIALSGRGVGGRFNIATGKDYAVSDLVTAVGDILGKKLTIKSERRRIRPENSEVSRLLGDGTLADRTFRLGKRTDLKAGLAPTISYFEAHLDEFSDEDYQL